VPCLLVFTALLLSAVTGSRWVDVLGRWLPSSRPLRLTICVVVVPVAYFLLVKIIWKVLPTSIRAHIPYDRGTRFE
jgi:hypothetical protein